MASAALLKWRSLRRAQLVELYDAHRAVGGTGPGRRTATEQLNWALALRLAGEFQGYARDLHDQATAVLASTAPTKAIESVLELTFTLGRKLDVGNAHRSALQQDFTRLGIPILDRVKSHSPQGDARLKALDDLNTARNAIAHSQPVNLLSVLGAAPSLRLTQIRRWDSALRGLASTMDVVVSAELAALSGGGKPW